MPNIKKNKEEQINNIVSVIKLVSLLFCGIILFKYILDNESKTDIIEYATITSTGIAMCVILLIYCMWTFWTVKGQKVEGIKGKQAIENIIFIGIFLFMILLSGGYTSHYKFLFLFLVIANTIQSGLKHGMIIACISSICILLIDLIGYCGGTVNTYFEDDLALAGVFILTAWPLGYYVQVEQEYIEQLTKLANCDGLTGVYNHRFFHNKVAETMEIARENNEPLSILFMEIDDFKYYNDLNGHQKGDEVLKIIGKLLKEVVGDNGIVTRYGGEEFAVILPNVDGNSMEIAEDIRKSVEETYIIGQENQPTGNITISVGIATYPENAASHIELIKSADDALYREKFFNKNRVKVYSSILDDLKKDLDEEQGDIITSIKTLISVINAKDKYTYGHSERVVIYSKIFAGKVEMNEEDTKQLIYSAYMHDIGKINIPEDILNKGEELTREEYEIVKKHPRQGVEIIQTINPLSEMSAIVMSHHERYDGKGYPEGLRGEEIPRLARVLNVIDSFDAMTSNRSYNKKKNYKEAFQELRQESGTQFDPEIVEQFIAIVIENKEELKDIS
ncbi:MAG: diguanylate cyclase [Cellulosilyticaceae bacterium]